MHFDAHADLRQDYLGEPLSHACVMRRCLEKMNGPQCLLQIGIRSGPKEEWEWMRSHHTIMDSPKTLQKRLADLGKNRPVYVSIDLDVFDPGLFCGTGTPEPGGMPFTEFYSWLEIIAQFNVVSADVMELSPVYDASGVSSLVAAKVVRECLLGL